MLYTHSDGDILHCMWKACWIQKKTCAIIIAMRLEKMRPTSANANRQTPSRSDTQVILSTWTITVQSSLSIIKEKHHRISPNQPDWSRSCSPSTVSRSTRCKDMTLPSNVTSRTICNRYALTVYTPRSKLRTKLSHRTAFTPAARTITYLQLVLFYVDSGQLAG